MILFLLCNTRTVQLVKKSGPALWEAEHTLMEEDLPVFIMVGSVNGMGQESWLSQGQFSFITLKKFPGAYPLA